MVVGGELSLKLLLIILLLLGPYKWDLYSHQNDIRSYLLPTEGSSLAPIPTRYHTALCGRATGI